MDVADRAVAGDAVQHVVERIDQNADDVPLQGEVVDTALGEGAAQPLVDRRPFRAAPLAGVAARDCVVVAVDQQRQGGELGADGRHHLVVGALQEQEHLAQTHLVDVPGGVLAGGEALDQRLQHRLAKLVLADHIVAGGREQEGRDVGAPLAQTRQILGLAPHHVLGRITGGIQAPDQMIGAQAVDYVLDQERELEPGIAFRDQHRQPLAVGDAARLNRRCRRQRQIEFAQRMALSTRNSAVPSMATRAGSGTTRGSNGPPCSRSALR